MADTNTSCCSSYFSGRSEVAGPVVHLFEHGFVGLHHFHVLGGERIVSQELLVAVPERHDGIGLNVLDGIDVLALGSLGGVRAPTGSCLVLVGGLFLLGGGFPSARRAPPP